MVIGATGARPDDGKAAGPSGPPPRPPVDGVARFSGGLWSGRCAGEAAQPVDQLGAGLIAEDIERPLGEGVGVVLDRLAHPPAPGGEPHRVRLGVSPIHQ